MNFAHDPLSSGRTSHVLTVIDKLHWHCVAPKADFALTGLRVVDAMNTTARECEPPHAIIVDQIPESTARMLDEIRAVLEAWRDDYCHRCQHRSLGHLTPSEFAMQDQKVNVKATKIQF